MAAKLGIADLLADGPRWTDELAIASRGDAGALLQPLRALASVGVFEVATPRQFALTPEAGPLHSGVPRARRVHGRRRVLEALGAPALEH